MTYSMTYHGGGAEIVNSVFVGPSGFDIGAISLSSTEVVMLQPETLDRLVVQGAGFTFTDDDAPTGGTVSVLQFQSSDGTTILDVTGLDWALVAFNSALESFALWDFSAWAALFSGDDLSVTAANATDGLNMEEMSGVFQLVTSNATIVGSDHKDTLAGGAGNDGLYGGDDNDSLYGRAGDDTIDGGDGYDVLRYDLEGGSSGVEMWSFYNQIKDTFGNTDYITGIEHIWGTEQDDLLRTHHRGGVLTLLGGDDYVTLGHGNDLVYAGSGSDDINDSGGEDTVSFDADFADATLTLTNETIRVTFSYDPLTTQHEGADLSGVEILEFNDRTLHVQELFPDYPVDPLYFYGTAGKDTLIGVETDDVIHSFDGNDTIAYTGGADTIDGGLGKADQLSFSKLQDIAGRPSGAALLTLDMEQGTAELWDGHGGVAFSGIEAIRGSRFDDLLYGYSSASIGENVRSDTIHSLDGDDTIFAKTGDDYVNAGAGNDSVNGGGGDDVLIGEGGWDSISGDAGNDSIDGMNGNDYLFGRSGDDSLIGGGGRDRLRGNDGNDTMEGGGKNDYLLGGAGADVFVFSGAWAKDYIKDFTLGVDRVVIEGGFDADDVSFKLNKAGTAVIATVKGGGKIVFENHTADQLADFADWDFLA